MWQRVYFSLCSSAFIPHQSLLLNFVCHNFPIPQSFVILNWNLPNLWHWCCLCQESEDGFPLGSGSTLSKVRLKCRKHFLCSFILVVVYLRYYRTINSSILAGRGKNFGTSKWSQVYELMPLLSNNKDKWGLGKCQSSLGNAFDFL